MNFFGIEQYLDDEEVEDLKIGLKQNNISIYDFMIAISQNTFNFTEKTWFLPSEKDMRRIVERTYLQLKQQ